MSVRKPATRSEIVMQLYRSRRPGWPRALLLAIGVTLGACDVPALASSPHAMRAVHPIHATDTMRPPTGLPQAAHAGKGVIGIPPPCLPAALRVRVSLPGYITALYGAITVTNGSSHACTVRGRPAVTITGRAVHMPGISEQSLYVPSALEAVELVPGQHASVELGWSNYCGAQPGPFHLLIRFAAWNRAVETPIGGRPLAPACVAKSRGSTLFVGTTSPLHNQPSDAVIIYYPFISNHRYDLAREYLSGKRPSRQALARHYHNTQRIQLQLLGVPLYRIVRHRVPYTCVSTEFVALLRNGTATQYGGWYMVASRGPTDHKLVLQGSRIRIAGIPEIPDRATCAAHIPK